MPGVKRRELALEELGQQTRSHLVSRHIRPKRPYSQKWKVSTGGAMGYSDTTRTEKMQNPGSMGFQGRRRGSRFLLARPGFICRVWSGGKRGVVRRA